MKTRIPFRYGIAEMTAAPHVLVQLDLHDGASTTSGWASEHLPPKWFVKDPEASFAQEVGDLTRAIVHAASAVTGRSGASAFTIALELDDAQQDWARNQGYGGLLAGLGTALVERALIDAVCRASGLPFVDALDRGVLGFDPAAIHPELAGRPLTPAARPSSIDIRHTVGLGDPLTDEEVTEDVADELPVSLESAVRRYGLRWLKLKTRGDAEVDIERIARVEEVCARAGVTPGYTIDGNESMTDGDQLVEWLTRLRAAPGMGPVFERLAAVEQPLHRSMALSPQVAPALRRSAELAAVIIDESDAHRDSIREGMDLGYAGGTYKGCKGVFRGLANAALVAARGEEGRRTVLTAEDLCTVPPLTVGQDLVVAAAIGLTHIERNGHHYFGQFAPLGAEIETQALAAHPDAYVEDGSRVRLWIRDGAVSLGTLLRAPFGFAPEPDPTGMAELSVETAVGLA